MTSLTLSLFLAICLAVSVVSADRGHEGDDGLPICNVHKFLQKSGKNVAWSYCGLLSSNETVCKIRCNESGEVFETPSTGEFKCTPEGVWTPDTIPNCVKKEQEAPPPPSVTPPSPVVCLKNQFLCADNVTCVGILRRCNNVSDCEDSSDEAGCEHHKCARGDRLCLDGITCVSHFDFCDGSEDCPGGSDEKDCGSISNCNAPKFIKKSWEEVGYSCRKTWKETVCKMRCKIRGEIFETTGEFTGEFKCNHEGVWTPDTPPNCVKKEQGEPPPSSVPPPPPSVTSPSPAVCLKNQFLCADNMTCVSKSVFCDGNEDCPGGSDEEDCDTCLNWGCSHQCEETSQGPRCSCEELFELDPEDKRTCKNKCEKLGCSQTCSETSDGLQCSCHHGFEPDPKDKRTCKRCSPSGGRCWRGCDCCDKKQICEMIVPVPFFPGTCEHNRFNKRTCQ